MNILVSFCNLIIQLHFGIEFLYDNEGGWHFKIHFILMQFIKEMAKNKQNVSKCSLNTGLLFSYYTPWELLSVERNAEWIKCEYSLF